MWAFLLLPLLASSHPLDDYYRSTARPYTAAEERFSEGPQIPFTNFSKGYIQKALALPLVDWNAQGAVTPVKSQAGHGFCGTFGRVGSAESQWVLRGGGPLTSFSEQMLISCVGWDKDQAAFFEPNGFMSTASYPCVRLLFPHSVPALPAQRACAARQVAVQSSHLPPHTHTNHWHPLPRAARAATTSLTTQM